MGLSIWGESVSGKSGARKPSIVLGTPVFGNPVVRTFLLPGEQNSPQRYWLEVFVTAGIMIALIAPAVVTVVIEPVLLAGIVPYKAMYPDSTDCLVANQPPTACVNSTINFSYYFWNITNTNEVRVWQRARVTWVELAWGNHLRSKGEALVLEGIYHCSFGYNLEAS
jgi:hypothetical protein